MNMTDSKHTPGPWRWGASFDDLRPVWYSEMSQGAGYISWDDEERKEANARLIAAAPDLLEALESIIVDDSWGLEHNVYMKCRAAIKKARG